jgi:hypothetical protein
MVNLRVTPLMVTSTQEVGPVPSEDFQTPSDEQIQLLRKDIRAQRKQLIAANMKLSGAEAEEILAHL